MSPSSAPAALRAAPGAWLLIALGPILIMSGTSASRAQQAAIEPPSQLVEHLPPIGPAELPLSRIDAPPAAGLPGGGLTAAEYFEGAVLPADDRFAALEKKIKDLEKQVKDLTPKKEAKDAWVDMSADKWSVKLGGHVQMDWINWAHVGPDPPPANARDYFEFRRLRLLADGTGYGTYDFRIQIDIEPENGDSVTTPVTDIKDAYFTMSEIPWISRWRIGNFFVPFSLEQVTNDTNNIFLERSIPTQGIFAADREVGMAMYGVSEDLNHTWTFGAFFDSISESLKERIDNNQGQRFSGRLTWLPYYDEPTNGRYLFHVGTGLLHTEDQDDSVRFRARPQIHEGPFLIDTGPIAAKSYTSANLELATVWGQVSVQSELFATSLNRNNGETPTLYGGYVYLSYFLTGENRVYERYGQHGAQFARNVPFTNFFLVPGGYGSGAWEAKIRTSFLGLDAVDSGHYNDITCGFNWYWSDRVRVMFDWIHPWTSADSTPFGSTQSDIIGTRFDFNF